MEREELLVGGMGVRKALNEGGMRRAQHRDSLTKVVV